MAAISQLGKYQIRRELGHGAMGVVYEGFDPQIERVVALKTILPESLNGPQSNDLLTRFKREAQAAGRLNHPGIVAVYDYGEEMAHDEHGQACGKIAFIAMEFVKGRELREWFEHDTRFTLADTERIMYELLDALGHAHSQGVVHRDIKPANLIMLDNGKLKIADFGIARLESSDLTQVGTVMGTPSYMSPEQFMGQIVDGRSDLFSCGVILYQLLTGERPFTGNSTTIMYKVLNESPLNPSLLNANVPPGLDLVLKKALAKVPGDRYQSALGLYQAIAEAVHRQDAAVINADADATVVHTRTAPPPPSQPGTQNTTRQQPPSMPPLPPRAEPTGQTTASPPPAQAARPGSAPNGRGAGATGGAGAPPAAAATQSASGKRTGLIAAACAALFVLAGLGWWFGSKPDQPNQPELAQSASAPQGSSHATASATPGAIASAMPSAADTGQQASGGLPATIHPPTEAGHIVVSAMGLVDPKDPKFNGDSASAHSEARQDAKRQLVEKVLALYLDNASLNQNYALLEQKLLSNHGNFIKTTLSEQAPVAGKHGLLGSEMRAVLNMREVQKSLNQLSRAERIDFIRNHGDPKISIRMGISNADNANNTQALPANRSQLAENILKERIKSFGFRIWAMEGEVDTASSAKSADFHIEGQAKLKQLSAKLPASGLTISKTVLTSWTVKAIDKSSGEEIYLNTVMPKGQSWASEDLALQDIGKQMGDEFSKDFFLQHFNFGVKQIILQVNGLPDAHSAQRLLSELRSIRPILDIQLQDPSGRYQLQLAQAANGADILDAHLIRPLNQLLGQACFSLGNATETSLSISFASACHSTQTRAKLDQAPPSGLIGLPTPRGKQLLKSSNHNTI